MSEESLRAVKCLNCSSDLPSKWARTVEQPCPECGSTELAITMDIVENMSLHECLKGRVKDSNRSSRENPRVRFQVGDSYSRRLKKWVKRNMRVDRDRDLYQEVVMDPDTGAIIHECEEPLSQHRGHGSARRAPSPEGQHESE